MSCIGSKPISSAINEDVDYKLDGITFEETLKYTSLLLYKEVGFCYYPLPWGNLNESEVKNYFSYY